MDGNENGPIRLRVVSPAGLVAETVCDSVHLTLADGGGGRGGGDIGILKNHAPAVLALARGPVRAALAGQTVLSRSVAGGFASVRDNVVTVITDAD